MAAFCWVTESISATAVFTWPMPLLCSAAPLLISSITSVTRATSKEGVWSLVTPLVLTTVIWVSKPWVSPAQSAATVAWSSLALWGLLPWARWIERGRVLQQPTAEDWWSERL